jgi:RNase P/RNase MRP subunit p29
MPIPQYYRLSVSTGTMTEENLPKHTLVGIQGDVYDRTDECQHGMLGLL